MVEERVQRIRRERAGIVPIQADQRVGQVLRAAVSTRELIRLDTLRTRTADEQARLGDNLSRLTEAREELIELQARKRQLADAIISADNSGLAGLTREDLELLLG